MHTCPEELLLQLFLRARPPGKAVVVPAYIPSHTARLLQPLEFGPLGDGKRLEKGEAAEEAQPLTDEAAG
jgi:hypothetical protein